MSSIKIEREERNAQGKSSGGSFWNERRNPRTVGNVPWWEMGGASNPLLLLLLFLVLLLNCPKCLSEEPWNSPPFSTLILLCIYKIYSCQGPVRQSPKNPKRIPSTAQRKSQIIDKKLFRRILTDSFLNNAKESLKNPFKIPLKILGKSLWKIPWRIPKMLLDPTKNP